MPSDSLGLWKSCDDRKKSDWRRDAQTATKQCWGFLQRRQKANIRPGSLVPFLLFELCFSVRQIKADLLTGRGEFACRAPINNARRWEKAVWLNMLGHACRHASSVPPLPLRRFATFRSTNPKASRRFRDLLQIAKFEENRRRFLK